MWFASSHRQHALAMLQVHVSDPLPDINRAAGVKQRHGPRDSPRRRKLPVAFQRVYAAFLQWREKMPMPAQATCTWERGVTAGWRRLAVTVRLYKETARLLDTTVVDEQVRMNCCRSVTIVDRPRMYGACGVSSLAPLCSITGRCARRLCPACKRQCTILPGEPATRLPGRSIAGMTRRTAVARVHTTWTCVASLGFCYIHLCLPFT